MNIEIDSLTTSEKLALVDRIWSSIHTDPDSVPSPAWHEELLAERIRRLDSGESTVSSLADVKSRLEKPCD